jgi:sulfhydrogenase subunit beta (sulfur reductase)
MELCVIKKSDINEFVQQLIRAYAVEGVKSRENSFCYGSIQSPEELCLDYDCTIASPKRYFLPPKETLLRFTNAPNLEITPVIESDPFILIGVHPYDIKAINQMDKIFSRGTPDTHYLKRRNAAVIIGVEPTRVTSRSFWADMDAATVSEGFDLMLTDIGEHFTVEIGSEKGRDLLEHHVKNREATKDESRRRIEARYTISTLCKIRGLNFPQKNIPKLLEFTKNSIFWEERASKCLSCGTCNLVCPTCYCFDVFDTVEIDGAGGERLRRWDGCLLEDFAKVASGENFRESRTARYRHRFMRKGLYLFNILGEVACVGCGRCALSCLPDIADPLVVFNQLTKDI